MEREKRKELIRKFGLSSMTFHFHSSCENRLEAFLTQRKDVILPDSRKSWQPADLIGRWRDIDQCDLCGQVFEASDTGYISITATSQEELELWKEIQKEPKSAEKT